MTTATDEPIRLGVNPVSAAKLLIYGVDENGQMSEQAQRRITHLLWRAGQVLPDLLTAARAEFFAAGDGRELRERERRLREAEAEAQQASDQLAEIRAAWERAVVEDRSEQDVKKLEEERSEQEALADRLSVRVPALRDAVNKCRAETAPRLEECLRQKLARFAAEAEERKRVTLAALRDAVNATFLNAMVARAEDTARITVTVPQQWEQFCSLDDSR